MHAYLSEFAAAMQQYGWFTLYTYQNTIAGGKIGHVTYFLGNKRQQIALRLALNIPASF